MYPEHLKTFDYVGPHRYFLTFCTVGRAHLFVRTREVQSVHAQILRAGQRSEFAVLAYCYMPDHLHLLVQGQTEGADGRRFIKMAKQLSGYYFHRQFGRQLWQRYGFERTLRDESSSISVARYIIENPIRAGLAARVADYAFVGSEVYPLESILEAVQMDRTWLGRSG